MRSSVAADDTDMTMPTGGTTVLASASAMGPGELARWWVVTFVASADDIGKIALTGVDTGISAAGGAAHRQVPRKSLL